ncbi:MAG: OmpH family outer membrane protein [Rickettsiaceae bacterium]|nr:OmpH family outer membrane protein [Rickettsiaceae bacterium]
MVAETTESESDLVKQNSKSLEGKILTKDTKRVITDTKPQHDNIVKKEITSSSGEKFITRVAVVDIQSVFEHSLAAQKIRESINSISQKIDIEVSAKQRELKEIEAELIKKRGTIDEEEFQARVTEFSKTVSEAQQMVQSKKRALEQAHAQAIIKVQEQITLIIEELAEKYELNLVLPSIQVLYINNDMNITLEVISTLNKKLKSVEVKYNM